MPTLDITDAHRDRIETLREELAAAHAGAYASVDTDDALAYLLDLADAVDDPDRTADPEIVGDAAESGTRNGPGDAGDKAAVSDDAGADDDGGSGQLNAMMSLLDTHEDKWREGDGDVRYEVDLPDGTVEAARTKDDVRALLFKNY
jgi:hypothetical protein